MKKVLFVLWLASLATQTTAQKIFEKDNLLAWCVVPFDSLKRGPEARMQMFKALGIRQYAYDWRAEHLPEFGREIDLARENNIAMEAVWLWVDNNSDQAGRLSAANEEIIKIVADKKLKTTFWVGFNNNFFDGLSHREKVGKGAAFLKFLHDKLQKINCKVAFYNHGDWFGEPENEIEIIKSAGLKNVGIVYSFHHGHHQINRFHSMLQNMKPYLAAVNLNGMDLAKGQILTIGQGKHEREMLQMLRDSGYRGRIGIIGHLVEEDVKKVLERNMEGLEKIKPK